MDIFISSIKNFKMINGLDIYRPTFYGTSETSIVSYNIERMLVCA